MPATAMGLNALGQVDPAYYPNVWRTTRYAERSLDEGGYDVLIDGKDGYASRASRPVEVPFRYSGDQVQAAVDFLGYTTVDTRLGSGNFFLSRAIPHQHPDWNWLYASSMKIGGLSPWGKDLGAELGPTLLDVGLPVQPTGRYRVWRCGLEYTARTYEVYTDQLMRALGYVDSNGNPAETTLQRYVTKLGNPGQEYLQLPGGSMKLVSPNAAGAAAAGAAVAPFGVGKITAKFDVAYVWHQIPQSAVPTVAINPSLSAPAIDLCLGKVNQAAFNGWPAMTLLFVAAPLHPIRMANGERAYDIEYRFQVILNRDSGGSYVGHNGILQRTTSDNIDVFEAASDGVTHAATVNNKHVYDGSDFTTLFKVGV